MAVPELRQTPKTKSEDQRCETELLRAIRRRKPRELRVRYPQLIEKRRAETLTSEEYEELLRLTEQAEAFNGDWLRALAELSRLRQTTLPALMKDLGISPQIV